MRTTGFNPGGNGRWTIWSVLAIAAVALSAITAIRWRETARLRAEIAAQGSAQTQEAGLLRANRPEGISAVADEADRSRLRADRDALPRLRAEVAALKKSVEGSRSLPAKSPGRDPEVPPDIGKELVPAALWRNLGYATPSAAVETALWAAAGGDTDVLMGSIVMDDGAKRKAEALLAGLPAEARARYSTPEELVVFMAAKDVPLEGARIFPSNDQSGETTRTVVQLRNAAGSVRQVHLDLRKTSGGWRLVVPEAAVERYAEQLKRKGR